MIVFDLQCTAGHVFEAWFGSSEDWRDQRERALVECPLCGDRAVEKAVMAPAVGAKSNRRPQAAATPMMAGADPGEIKAMLAAIARAQAEVLKDADYVGDRFAGEARAMHLGETDPRGIYGEVSAQEAKDLLDEGVPVAPLLLPVRPGKTDA